MTELFLVPTGFSGTATSCTHVNGTGAWVLRPPPYPPEEE